MQSDKMETAAAESAEAPEAPEGSNAEEQPTPAVPKRCANCGAERAGVYCHECGQQFLDGRLTFGRLWQQFAARFFNVERGFWRSLHEVVTDPGGLARRYVNGERKRYTNPLSLYLVVAAVSYLIFVFYEPVMLDIMAGQLGGDNFTADEAFRKAFGAEDPARGYAEFMFDLMKQGYTYMNLALCFPLAVLLRLFFKNRDPEYNWTETFVFSVFFVTVYVVLVTLTTPLMLYIGQHWMLSLVLTTGAGAALCVYAARGFYGGGTSTMVLAAVSFVASYIVYFILQMVIMAGLMIYRIAQASG